jgi:hypothetical protein
MVEVAGRRAHVRLAHACQLDRVPVELGLVAPAVGGALGHRAERDRGRGRSGLAVLGQAQEVREQLGQSLGLELAGHEVALEVGVLGAQARRLQAQAQPGPRGAQLVGSVGHEVALGVERAHEPVGHVVEGVGDFDLLGGAGRRGPRVQVAGGDLPRRARQAAQRARQRAGDGPREAQPERQHGGAEGEQGDDIAAHLVVDGLDALGQAHRAGRPAGVDDGDRRIEQIGLEGVAVARPLRGGAAQRRGDLGTAGVGCAAHRATVGVHEHAAAGVDDDDTAAQALALLTGQRGEGRRVGEPPRGGRGHRLGSRARLGLDLAVDPSGEVQRQRDLQRDDRKEQDIAEGEDEPEAQAHGAWDTAAFAKRKPTPRTVCR